MIRRIPVEADRIRPKLTGLSGSLSGKSVSFLPLGFPEGVAERSESFKMMIAGGNHSKIRKLDFLAIGTSEPIAKKD